MPILQNAKKALRVAERRTEINRRVKSRVKTTRDAVEAKQTPENIAAAFSAIDKAVRSNLFHKNKAARLKSQVSKLKVA